MEKYLQAVNNYFEAFYTEGNFTIADGVIIVGSSGFVKNQYIRVLGSILNGGVYKVAGFADNKLSFDEPLQDETFGGVIVGLAIKPVFIKLVAQIEEWDRKRRAFGADIIRSESVPNLSTTYRDDDFKTQFAEELRPFRKMPPQDVFGFMRHTARV